MVLPRPKTRRCSPTIAPSWLGLEGLPDRLVRSLGMAMGLGKGDALVEQPSVQLLIIPEAQPRCEEAPVHQPDLVLDLALLPARRWRADDPARRDSDCTSAKSGG